MLNFFMNRLILMSCKTVRVPVYKKFNWRSTRYEQLKTFYGFLKPIESCNKWQIFHVCECLNILLTWEIWIKITGFLDSSTFSVNMMNCLLFGEPVSHSKSLKYYFTFHVIATIYLTVKDCYFFVLILLKFCVINWCC